MGLRPDIFAGHYFDEWKSIVESVSCVFESKEYANDDSDFSLLAAVCDPKGLDKALQLHITANGQSIEIEMLRYIGHRYLYSFRGEANVLGNCILSQLRAAGCTTRYHLYPFRKVEVWRIDKGLSYDVIDRIRHDLSGKYRVKYENIWRSRANAEEDSGAITFTAGTLKVGLSQWEIWTGPVNRTTQFIGLRALSNPLIACIYRKRLIHSAVSMGGTICPNKGYEYESKRARFLDWLLYKSLI